MLRDIVTRAFYITGTDTGVGKSLASAALLVALNARGVRAVGMKPVASGCVATAQGLRNADAELLIAHGAIAPDYALVNPYAFVEPIAPHIAAAHAGVRVELSRIEAAFAALCTMSQSIVVEGVGGWMAPLDADLMQSDLVRALKLPAILVVGLRLGCINHALLTARAIQADGCTLAGWIASCVDPEMLCVEENLATLRARLPAQCLGVLPHAAIPDPRTLGAHLDVTGIVLPA